MSGRTDEVLVSVQLDVKRRKDSGLDALTRVFHCNRFKGMASSPASSGSAPRTPTRATPQQTGFSQVGSRPGVSGESTGAAMSVLLSWHEKVVDVAGLGCIGRVMTDWRKV